MDRDSIREVDAAIRFGADIEWGLSPILNGIEIWLRGIGRLGVLDLRMGAFLAFECDLLGDVRWSVPIGGDRTCVRFIIEKIAQEADVEG